MWLQSKLKENESTNCFSGVDEDGEARVRIRELTESSTIAGGRNVSEEVLQVQWTVPAAVPESAVITVCWGLHQSEVSEFMKEEDHTGEKHDTTPQADFWLLGGWKEYTVSASPGAMSVLPKQHAVGKEIGVIVKIGECHLGQAKH